MNPFFEHPLVSLKHIYWLPEFLFDCFESFSPLSTVWIDRLLMLSSGVTTITGHLIGCNKKLEIVRYVQGRLCDKIGLHCFTRFQWRKTTLMLFNGQFECKGIIKYLFKSVRLFWPAKEKGHLFSITWCPYTTDHTACLWNQNGCPDIAIEGFRCLARLSLVVNHLK